MESTISEDLFGNVDQAKLDQPCGRKHLNKISGSIARWEELAPYLDLDEVEIEDIKEEHSSPKRRRQAMLGKWKKKNGTKATYRKLAKIFASQGRRNLVEELCKTVMEESSSSDEDQILESKHTKTSAAIIAQYGDHLKSIYQTELIYSLEISDFLPSQTRAVFNLALIDRERVQYGTEIVKRMQEILNSEIEEKKEVKLENIFESGQHGGRQFILLEGAPGAGKSALACFICQKWGVGELFQEFQFVIFIQLNNPHIQSAQSLADIFHSGSHFATHKIVSSLQSTQGRGVLFIMDGWDEYPLQSEEGSLIEKLICSPSEFSMQLSTIIVTSRPVASGKLQRYCSSRLEIIGYKQKELECFFRETLQGNPQKITKLNEFLDTMPLIKKSCRLPLNAAIVAHTFKCSDGSLPSTLYDLYRILVSSIIHRRIVKVGHGCKSESDPNDDDYLRTLPLPFREQFANLCKLAFDGVIKNVTIFSADDLRCHKISPESTLSLLHGVPSFVRCRQSVFYNFMHLMIQEFLAADYILQLPLDDQIEAFQKLFGQPRFVAVFQFYAFKAKFDQMESASKFCSFFAQLFRRIRSHVDRQSQRLPQKWQGDLERLKCTDPQVAISEVTNIEPNSVPQPLSLLDPIHIVVYISLPYFDVGYVLASVSVARDGEIKFEICLCVRDDVMMYGHMSGARRPSASQHASTPPTGLPNMYCSIDLVSMLASSTDFNSAQLLQSLPKVCSTIRDRFLVMSYISPTLFQGLISVFNSDAEYDCSNILFVGNATSEVQMMQSVHQEFEAFQQNCQIQ